MSEDDFHLVHIHVNPDNSFIDIGRIQFSGNVSWLRLRGTAPMDTYEQLVSQLISGTANRPPSLRVGADRFGIFIEVIEPKWFMRHYAASSARILNTTVEEIIGPRDPSYYFGLRVYGKFK